MSDEKRQEIKERIEAAQARNMERMEPSLGETLSEKAKGAKDGFTDFAKKHPVATVAGGVVVGVLVASLFKGPRRAAYKAGSKTAGLAALGAEIASAFAAQALDSATIAGRLGADKLEDLEDGIGDKARELKRSADHQIGDASDQVRILARGVSKSLARSFRRH